MGKLDRLEQDQRALTGLSNQFILSEAIYRQMEHSGCPWQRLCEGKSRKRKTSSWC